MANITGWGRGTWGQSAWGEPLSVTITAPNAATATVGNIAIDAAGRFGIIGVAATTGSPTAGVNAQAIAVATSAVATLGSVTVDVDGEANVAISGVAGTSAVGSVTVHHNAQFSIDGFSVTSSLGAITSRAGANISLTGVEATAFVNNVLVWSRIDETQTPNWVDVA